MHSTKAALPRHAHLFSTGSCLPVGTRSFVQLARTQADLQARDWSCYPTSVPTDGEVDVRGRAEVGHTGDQDGAAQKGAGGVQGVRVRRSNMLCMVSWRPAEYLRQPINRIPQGVSVANAHEPTEHARAKLTRELLMVRVLIAGRMHAQTSDNPGTLRPTQWSIVKIFHGERQILRHAKIG